MGEDEPPGGPGVHSGKWIRCGECLDAGICPCELHRRDVISGITGAVAGGIAAILGSRDVVRPVEASAAGTTGDGGIQADGASEGDVFESDPDADPDAAFPQSVASGGPTSSGVILWTRVDPDARREGVDLGVEVATDRGFADGEVVYRGVVGSDAIRDARGHVVKVDLDGELDADSFYRYRFVYDGVTSRTGRCRTLPGPDDDPDELELAIANCNHYQVGQFHAFDHVADETADYLLHLGDMIYEGVRSDPVPGREIALPGGGPVAADLTDFRALHQAYRSDRSFQRALESHTLIAVPDDHEVANARYWDYDADRPVLGDGVGDPGRAERITADGLQAWVEYVPARVEYDPDADHLHDQFRLYRSVEFGDLAEIVGVDERLYREEPPCDYLDVCEQPGDDPDYRPRSMLGDRQREWFLDRIQATDAQWVLWLTQVLTQPITLGHLPGDLDVEVMHQAWDGYRHERQEIMEAVADADLENFVALSGDMHATVAGHLKTDYRFLDPDPGKRRVGVEFLAPAVTSSSVSSFLSDSVPFSLDPEGSPDLLAGLLKRTNPHLAFADWHHHGYATLTVDREGATFTVYAVDRDAPADGSPGKQILAAARTPAGEPVLEPAPTAVVEASTHEPDPGSAVTFDARGSTPSPDADGLGNVVWDFDDGTGRCGETVEYAFDSPGEYRVTATVVDDAGAVDTATTTVAVGEMRTE